jgi:hypothetical protein
VAKGDTVKKAHILDGPGHRAGRGDHLHFGVLVSGCARQPRGMWDQHWIDDNFIGKLGK